MSGSTNAGDAFDLVATHEAKDSTYAGIVRLVETAQRSKAPVAQLSDRWSLGFLAITLTMATAPMTPLPLPPLMSAWRAARGPSPCKASLP